MLIIGQTPYAGINSPRGIMDFLERGERLLQPATCPTQVYQILLRCWQWSPQDRPKLEQVPSILSQVKLDCPPEHEYQEYLSDNSGLELSSYLSLSN